MHVHAHAHCDVWAGAAWADLLYSLRCIFLCIESCCIRPKIAVSIRRYTSDTRCVTALHNYTAIQSAIQRYTLYSYTALYTTQPLQHPSAAYGTHLEVHLIVLHGLLIAVARGRYLSLHLGPGHGGGTTANGSRWDTHTRRHARAARCRDGGGVPPASVFEDHRTVTHAAHAQTTHLIDSV